MHYLDRSRILTIDEIHRCLSHLHAKRSAGVRSQLTVFRLSCCLGLRRLEISGLQMGDIRLSGDRPSILVRADNTKGEQGKRRKRIVPLWWDSGTLQDIASWMQFRIDMGAGTEEPFVCSTRAGHIGKQISIAKVGNRWDTAVKASLGRERAKYLTIHAGRHSFCSHALQSGRSLLEVRDAAGHRSINTTNIYLHAIESLNARDVFAT